MVTGFRVMKSEAISSRGLVWEAWALATARRMSPSLITPARRPSRSTVVTNPTVPREFTNRKVSHVTIGKHVIVGTNAVIFPGVTIGEGAAVAACAVVRRDLPPWGVYGGEPLRKLGERDRAAILAKAAILLGRLEEAMGAVGAVSAMSAMGGGR